MNKTILKFLPVLFIMIFSLYRLIDLPNNKSRIMRFEGSLHGEVTRIITAP